MKPTLKHLFQVFVLKPAIQEIKTFKFRWIPDSSNKHQSKLLSQSLAFPGVPERAIRKNWMQLPKTGAEPLLLERDGGGTESCWGSWAFCLKNWEGWGGSTHPSIATVTPTLLGRNQSVILAHSKVRVWGIAVSPPQSLSKHLLHLCCQHKYNIRPHPHLGYILKIL